MTSRTLRRRMREETRAGVHTGVPGSSAAIGRGMACSSWMLSEFDLDDQPCLELETPMEPQNRDHFAFLISRVLSRAIAVMQSSLQCSPNTSGGKSTRSTMAGLRRGGA